MEDLDALLDELQLTTAHISNKQPSSDRISTSSGSVQSYPPSVSQAGRSSQTPPPLPPPPQDIPETIPPPQQFGDQPLYEAQNVRGDYRVSGSSQSSSRGSGDQGYQYREKSPPQQYQQPYQPPPQQYQHQNQGHPPPPQQQYQQQNQGHQPPPQQQYQQQSLGYQPQAQQQYQQQSPGYQPPVQQQYQHQSPGYQPPAQQQYQQQNQGYQAPPPQQPEGMSMISNNLSELDQLLNDLNSAQFLAEVDKKHGTPGKAPPPVAPKPARGESSVDNLLDQLETSVPSSVGPHGGYPVQQVVNYTYETLPEENVSVSNSQSPTSQSAATQELDNLMATLSDFKVKDNPQAQVNMPPPPRSPSPGSEPSYAKPHKSRNLSASSSMNSSLQSSSINTSAQGGQLETMLGDLQSDMNKQGVNTKTKGLCAACNQPVVGQVITALGKIWHIEHFTCAHCHAALGTKNFYERDNVAYCETDYHSLFAPRCSYCNGPIIDKCVTALNKTWHPEHFFCTLCGRPFGEEGFHEKDGKAYCKADFFEVFAPKCGGCQRAIVDNYITALNRHWHPECFACWECRQPFGGGSFFDYEGLPYCETHYHTKRGSLCAGCQKPITGRCITAMYKKFHPEHFVCAFCLKQLNKGTFKEQNDRPYCHPCFVKLFG